MSSDERPLEPGEPTDPAKWLSWFTEKYLADVKIVWHPEMCNFAWPEWWFNENYSEDYFAWGHVDKQAFADWINQHEYDGYDISDEAKAEDVEHIWASVPGGDRYREKFEISIVRDDMHPLPITRWYI